MDLEKLKKQINNLIGTLWDQESRVNGKSTIETLAIYVEDLSKKTKEAKQLFDKMVALEKEVDNTKGNLQNKIKEILGESESESKKCNTWTKNENSKVYTNIDAVIFLGKLCHIFNMVFLSS